MQVVAGGFVIFGSYGDGAFGGFLPRPPKLGPSRGLEDIIIHSSGLSALLLQGNCARCSFSVFAPPTRLGTRFITRKRIRTNFDLSVKSIKWRDEINYGVSTLVLRQRIVFVSIPRPSAPSQ